MPDVRPTPRTCGSCAHWKQNFCEAPIPAWVERYFSIEIVSDLADDDGMAEHCEMYQERPAERGGESG